MSRNLKIKLILTKKFLIKEYIKNKKSMIQIANQINYSVRPIYNRLKKYNIKKVVILKKINCVDCGKELSRVACYCKYQRCVKCSKIGKNNPNFGKHHKWSNKTKEKMSIAQSGNKNPAYIDGRSLKIYYCKDCNKEIHWTTIIYGQGRCNSCSKKYYYKMNPKISGNIGTPKGGYYKNIWMRSSWEIHFAQFLTLSGIKWLYEPETFNSNIVSYTPDFYIPEWNLYIEIKGWWRGQSKLKVDTFKNQYPEKRLIILFRKDLKEIGVI